MSRLSRSNSHTPTGEDACTDLVDAFEAMVRDGVATVEELPVLERDLFDLQNREEAQVRYEPEQLLELCDRLDRLLLSERNLAEIFRSLSHTLRDFFKSKYVEFLSLRGDGLIYEYITSPEWLLNIINRLTGLTAVLGMRIPLFEGSSFKEFIDAGKPRELVTFAERLRSMQDFVAPDTPEKIRLRKRWASPLMKLFGYQYVFQVPLIVQNHLIGYFSFLQKRRFSRRVRADIVLLSHRISNLILLKQREEERRHNLTEGLATLEAMHDAGRARVTGFRIRDVNPALLSILEAKREALVDQPIQAIGLCREEELVALTHVLQSHVPAAFVSKLGAKVCRFLVSKAESEDLILVVRDITAQEEAEEERRSLREQILHAQKLESLGVLAGGIAHDFNNLLAAILINAEVGMVDLPRSSPVFESLLDIKTAARRAADLTSRMLAYSGKGKFIIQPVDLTRLVREMVDLLKVSISKRAILDLHLEEQLRPIAADPTQLNQVVMNLITNASEALLDGAGRISISTGRMYCDRAYLEESYVDDKLPEDDYVFLEVEDTGCGMDEALLGRIFDPFFSTKFTGRGLGLAAVLGIVRSHQGAIRIQSAVGKGTSFRVLFPPLPELATGTYESVECGRDWQGTGRILLVDDEEVVRSAGKRLLERIGFEVLLAKDGEEAVRLFEAEAHRIRCVIMDLTMPRMNGHETTKELRRMRSDIPVLLSSGYLANTAMNGSAARDGIAGFIQKPYTLDVLRSKLREIFEPRVTIFR